MNTDNNKSLCEHLDLLSITEMHEIDPEQIKLLSSYASQQFKKGQVDTALRLFDFLTRIDAWCGLHWLNLGLCYQHFNEHDQALYCFTQAGYTDINDPYPAYYAALSYQAIKDFVKGKQALDTAINNCADHKEHRGLQHILQKIEFPEHFYDK